MSAVSGNQRTETRTSQNIRALPPAKCLQAQLFLIRKKYGIRLARNKAMQSTQKIKISAKRSRRTILRPASATLSAASRVGVGFSSPRASKGRALLSVGVGFTGCGKIPQSCHSERNEESLFLLSPIDRRTIRDESITNLARGGFFRKLFSRAQLSVASYGIVTNRMGKAQKYTILGDLISSSNRLANRQCTS